MTSVLLMLMIAVIVTAALISAIAWRYANDAHKRDVARAALLRHAATDGWDDRFTRTPAADDRAAATIAPIAVNTMFTSDDQPAVNGARQGWIAVAAVCVVVALVAATAAMRSAPPEAVAVQTTAPASAAAASPAASAPIALTALDHVRLRSGDLTVSGVVANPTGAAALDHVMAVIDALDDAKQVIATVTAGVDSPVLMAGGTTRFEVTIPHAQDVSSYRVRFQLRDGVALEHRDARRKS